MSHKIIRTDEAPAAVGPYSQGVVAGGLLFTAMQIALDPASGGMKGDTAPDQAKQCLKNVRAVAEAAGGSLDHAVKTMVYLTDISQFGAVNEVYETFFSQEPPARGVIESPNLPKGALVAIEAVVAL